MKKNIEELEKYSKKRILSICGPNGWDLGNEILYDMCKKYPYHTKDEEVIAKILFIGRIYSASIERRKNADGLNDDFYLKKVAPALKDKEIDRRIERLMGKSDIGDENVAEILELHRYVQDVFKKITGLEKRSLASKYLHFHLPNLFYLYDSRANSAVKKFVSGRMDWSDVALWREKNIDEEYAKYFTRVRYLHAHMNKICDTRLSPRQVDKFLIYIASGSKGNN